MAKPRLIVLSAPSGCGKTTIAREVMKKQPALLFSISATTRAKRQSEANSKDYFFLTKAEFERRIQAGELVEWERIYGDYYGTLKEEIERALRSGKPMLFDVDVKGAVSIKRKYPVEAVLIFLKPPSLAVLAQRLRDRKTESAETIQKRL